MRRYTAPWPNHVLYVIDTTNVESFREMFDFQPCNVSFINADFSFPSGISELYREKQQVEAKTKD